MTLGVLAAAVLAIACALWFARRPRYEADAGSALGRLASLEAGDEHRRCVLCNAPLTRPASAEGAIADGERGEHPEPERVARLLADSSSSPGRIDPSRC